ncbi:MAG: hypothetical protein ACRDVM_10440 [Acidimicrobiia bacterium]
MQALALHHLATTELPAGVHPFPAELDREIARSKLATLGIQLDELTPAQEEFFRSWQV